jgi:hypothetical protein
MNPNVTVQQDRAELRVLAPEIQRKGPERDLQPVPSLLEE